MRCTRSRGPRGFHCLVCSPRPGERGRYASYLISHEDPLTPRPYVDGASIICGFACYIPVPCLRGACFCLFPGLAQRSLRLAFKGAAIGFLADFVVTFIWMIVAGAWEPRTGYNSILLQNLPPDFVVATHVGSPMPNSFKFGIGLVFWTSTMYAIWMSLWRPAIPIPRRILILTLGAAAVAICAWILWIVTPLDEWWQYGAQPYGDLPPGPWLLVFLSVMPICSLMTGILIYLNSQHETNTQIDA